MHLNHWRRCLLAVVGLAVCGQGAASSPGAEERTISAAAGCVTSMIAILKSHAELRGLRAVGDLQLQLRTIAIHEVRMNRAGLQQFVADLPPGSAPARALVRFLEQWTDDAIPSAFDAAPGAPDGLDADLIRLSKALPRPSNWRTPFPIFRP
jgi:hypothetical protein